MPQRRAKIATMVTFGGMSALVAPVYVLWRAPEALATWPAAAAWIVAVAGSSLAALLLDRVAEERSAFFRILLSLRVGSIGAALGILPPYFLIYGMDEDRLLVLIRIVLSPYFPMALLFSGGVFAVSTWLNSRLESPSPSTRPADSAHPKERTR